MHYDKDSWLVDVKTIAKKFIEIHYSKESSLFEAFWSAFAFKIIKAIEVNNPSQPALSQIDRIATEISFTGGDSQDFITPIVTLTIAEVLHTLNAEKVSAAELKSIIHSSATRHGAKPSLVACLIRSLPVLYNEILICKDNNSIEAVISQSPKPSEYRIWTDGKNIILNSIDDYKKDKGKYLLWLDIDNPPNDLTPKSIRLLMHLVENIGSPTSITNIIQNVFDDVASENEREGDINKINQQLSKLEAFSAKRFRRYIMSGWPKESLGLNDDFRDKYFLFSRVSL